MGNYNFWPNEGKTNKGSGALWMKVCLFPLGKQPRPVEELVVNDKNLKQLVEEKNNEYQIKSENC